MSHENMVCFNNILINSVHVNSGIYVGTNSQSNWNSNNNNKSGFGYIIGTQNAVSRAVNIFMDNDMIDTPIITNNYNGLLPSADKTGKDNITIYGCRRGKKEHT